MKKATVNHCTVIAPVSAQLCQHQKTLSAYICVEILICPKVKRTVLRAELGSRSSNTKKLANVLRNEISIVVRRLFLNIWVHHCAPPLLSTPAIYGWSTCPKAKSNGRSSKPHIVRSDTTKIAHSNAHILSALSGYRPRPHLIKT